MRQDKIIGLENKNEFSPVDPNRKTSRFHSIQLRSGMFMLTAAAVLMAGTPNTQAGDREWATAGKVLTGVVAGSILLRALDHAPCRSVTTTYYAPPTVVYQQPVVYQQSVVLQQAPILVQPAPVYAQQAQVAQPMPVYAQPPSVVYMQPAPVVYYRTVTYGPVYRGPLFHRHHHGW